MRSVTPMVLPLASSRMDEARLMEYLEDIGATEYEITAPDSSMDALIEVCGKQCYRSWQPGLNPNVTKVRTENADYISNINKVAHGSVREHASITFVFWNVSRVFTHELVRHRAGCAISQESLRFVRLTDLGFWVPPSVYEYDPTDGEGAKLFRETVEHLERVQLRLAEIYGIEEMTNFSLKKQLTSMFRRLAPIGLATSIIWTANISALRHVIQQRTSRHAEEEIRLVFDDVAKFCVEMAPALFSDFKRREVKGIGEWWSVNATMPYDGAHLGEIVKAAKDVCVVYQTPTGGLKADTPESVQVLHQKLCYWGHLEGSEGA